MDPRLVDLIQQTAEKLGMTAQRLWPEMVLRFWIQSVLAVVVELVFIVGGTAIIVVAGKALARYHRTRQEAYERERSRSSLYVSRMDYDTVGWDIAAAGLALIAGFLIVIALVGLTSDIANAFVPEAGLTMKLLGK